MTAPTPDEINDRKKWKDGFDKDAGTYLEELDKVVLAEEIPEGYGLFREFSSALHSEFFMQGVAARTWVVVPKTQKKTVIRAMEKWHNRRAIEGKNGRFTVHVSGSTPGVENHSVRVLNATWARGTVAQDAVPIVIMQSDPAAAAVQNATNNGRPAPAGFVTLVIPCVALLPKHSGAGAINPLDMTEQPFVDKYGGEIAPLLEQVCNLTPRSANELGVNIFGGGDWVKDLGTDVHKSLSAFVDTMTVAIAIQFFVQGTGATNNEYRLPSPDLRQELSAAMREFALAKDRYWLEAKKPITIDGCELTLYSPQSPSFNKVPFMLMHETDTQLLRLAYPCRMRLPIHSGRRTSPVGMDGVVAHVTRYESEAANVIAAVYWDRLMDRLGVMQLPDAVRAGERPWSVADITRWLTRGGKSAARFVVSILKRVPPPIISVLSGARQSLSDWLEAYPAAAILIKAFFGVAGGTAIAAVLGSTTAQGIIAFMARTVMAMITAPGSADAVADIGNVTGVANITTAGELAAAVTNSFGANQTANFTVFRGVVEEMIKGG